MPASLMTRSMLNHDRGRGLHNFCMWVCLLAHPLLEMLNGGDRALRGEGACQRFQRPAAEHMHAGLPTAWCGAGAACNISLSRWQKPCVAQHRDACSNMELLSRDAAGPRTAEMAGCRDAARDHSGLSHSTMEGTRAAWPPRPRGTPVLAARHHSHTLPVYIPSARTWTNTGGRTLALRPSARALPARRLRPPARRQTALRRARPAPARPRPPRRRRRRRPRRPPPPRRPAAPQKRRPQRAAGHAAA